MNSYTVYFGGSFFPPHLGHDQMLRHLLRLPEVQKLFLVPTFQNPLKETPELSLKPTPEVKKKFIEAWTRSLSSKNPEGLSKLRTEWHELDQATPTYTLDTLSVLREREDDENSWAVCVGDDCIDGLSRWKNIEELLSILDEFWIFARGAELGSEILARIPKNLRELCVWRIVSASVMDVSSTEIRADASRERLQKLVLPEVAEVLQDCMSKT